MKEKRFVEDAEPYKLYYTHNVNTIHVWETLSGHTRPPDIPKNHFAAASVFRTSLSAHPGYHHP